MGSTRYDNAELLAVRVVAAACRNGLIAITGKCKQPAPEGVEGRIGNDTGDGLDGRPGPPSGSRRAWRGASSRAKGKHVFAQPSTAMAEKFFAKSRTTSAAASCWVGFGLGSASP